MFYEVWVLEDHRWFLELLWWTDGKQENPVIDWETNVHVFGSKWSLDYKDVCGSRASETLCWNFYVDDMLKSVKSEEVAVELVKDVKLMCNV